MKPKEQTSSPKMVKLSDIWLPTPSGSGNEDDNSEKAFHFCIPCDKSSKLKMILTASKRSDFFLSLGSEGNKNL